MKFLVLLLCLAQLWGCQSVPTTTLLGYRELPCDDPETESVAMVALNYLNENLVRGYKHTLNQIDKVKVWPRRPFGEVYELEIDTLETTCHILDPTPVANCSVRQLTQHAVEGDCDVHVLKLEGQLSVMHAKCHSTPDSAEDVQKMCPNCPLLAPLNDTKVTHAAEAALAAFNTKNNGSYFKIVDVSRAQLVTLPVSTYVEFAVAATNCAAKDVTDPANCQLLAEKQYGFCKATLTEKLGGEEVAVTCTVFTTNPLLVNANPADPAPVADQAAPVDPPAAAMVVKVPAGPPVQGTHHDLRYAFSGVTSVESASGEAFQPPKVAKPNAGPMVRPCPGRVRHFKI